MNTLRFNRDSHASSPSDSKTSAAVPRRVRRNLIISATVFLLLAGSALVWNQRSEAARGISHSGLAQLLDSAGRNLRTALNPLPVQAGQPVPYKISTIVGGGLSTDLPALQAPVSKPVGVARDPLGRGFYVLDNFESIYLLRFVNTSAQAVTLAGTTISPGSINLIAGGGDQVSNDSPARSVDLETVVGLVADPSGNAVYYHDGTANSVIALNVSNANFTIGNKTVLPGKIKEVFFDSRLSSDARARALAIDPTTHNFYFATKDSNVNKIFQVDPTTGSPAQIAGAAVQVVGSANALETKLSDINGIVVESNGSILLIETGDNNPNAPIPTAVRRITSGVISTLATSNSSPPSGSASGVYIAYPLSLTLAPNGDIYVANGNSQQVIKVNPATGVKTLVAGNKGGSDFRGTPCTDFTNFCGDGGPALSSSLIIPGSTETDLIFIAADNTGVFIPGFRYPKVRYVNLSGAAVTVAGKSIASQQIDSVAGNGLASPFDTSLATASELSTPLGVVADAQGNLYLADTFHQLLRFVNRTGLPINLFPGTTSALTVQPGVMASLNFNSNSGAPEGPISTATLSGSDGLGPQELAITSQGVFISLPDGGLKCGASSRSGIIRFLNTSSVNVNVFGIDVAPGEIRNVVGITGKQLNTCPARPIGDGGAAGGAGGAIIFPADIATDAAGNLYIAEIGSDKIRIVSKNTGIINSLSVLQSDSTPFTLSKPAAITFSPTGQLLIADTQFNRILRQNVPNGTAYSVIADSTIGISKPRGLTVDSKGAIFVLNSGNNQVVQITAAANALGTASVTAGTGGKGFSGDGGLATLALLNLSNPLVTSPTEQASSILALPNDDILFADARNNRIRRLEKFQNFAPVLAAVTNQTMAENGSLALPFSATDQNPGDTLTFTITGKPAFGVFTDNGNRTATLQLNPGFTDAGTYNITITVSDGALTDSKSFTLTVTDTNRLPVIVVNPLATPIDATSINGASVPLIGTITDPDSDPITWKWFDGANQIASGSGSNANTTVTLSIGFHTLTLQAFDNKGGSSSSAAQGVTVRDGQAPVIGTIPANQEFEGDTLSGKVFNFSNPTVTDNIDPNPTLTVSGVPAGNKFPVGTTTVIFTAKDTSNNIATKSFTVKVNDTQKPVISGVPASVTFEGDTLGGKVFNFSNPTATDIVSGTVTVIASGVPAGNKFPVGATFVTFTATDGAGNVATASFTVTVTDLTKPTISGIPADVTVEATSAQGVTVNYTLPTATDIVDGAVTVTADKASGTVFPIGTTTVNFSAKDSHLNTTTAFFKVTVRDTLPPVFTNIPANKTVPSTSAAGANVTFTLPTATDVVDGVVVVTAAPPSGSLFPVGNTTVTFSAQDSRANKVTTTIVISVVTVPPPTISGVPGDVILEATSPAGAVFTYQLPTAVSGQGAALQVQTTHPSGSTFPLGITTVTFTATDSLTLTSTATFKVTVVDTKPPVFSFTPPDITTEAPTPAGAVVSYSLPTATDLVSGQVTVLTDKASGSLFPIGTTTVTLTATDAKLNKATVTFKIIVLADVSYTISTFAGNGNYGFSGDGGQATAATFKQLVGVARDKQGRLLILDSVNRSLRRVDLNGTISTIAGNGLSSNGGDNKPATGANFGNPAGIAVDSQGNIYLADLTYNRIRRIGTDGVISHFAGDMNGAPGSTGDFGSAASARLRQPKGLAVDASDNLYITDSGNQRIRRIDALTKVITTVAGNGAAGFNGSGALATTLSLNNPAAVALDGQNNLYIADTDNQRVWRVDAASQSMAVLAGTGVGGFSGDDNPSTAAQLNNPNGVAADSAGNVFIADQNNHRIRRISKSTGKIRTVAGTVGSGFSGDGGPATQAMLNGPVAIACDEMGNNVFVADSGNLRVRKLSTGQAAPNNTPLITSPLGDQTIVKGQTLDIQLTASDQDNDPVTFTLVNTPAFASIINANPAQRTATLHLAPAATGVFSGNQVKADDGKGGVATSTPFSITVNDSAPQNHPPVATASPLPAMIEATSPAGASVNLSGSGTDADNDPLSFVWKDGATTIASSANATVTLGLGSHSLTLTVSDGKGGSNTTAPQTVLVKDSTAPVISGVPANLTVAATSAAGAVVNYALPTASDLVSGNVPVTASVPPGSTFPVGITTVKFTATDGAANTAMTTFTVTVTAFGSGNGDPTYTISTFAGNGIYGFTGDNGAATSASIRQISAVARDQNGNVYLTDSVSRVVRRIDTLGIITTIAGNGVNGNTGDGKSATGATFGSPSGVAVDAQGNIYIADSTFNRVRVITPNGTISHYAGDFNGAQGSTGDFGSASSAKLRQPHGLTVDAAGNLYISDTGNHRVRRVDAITKVITTIAGNGNVGFSGDNLAATLVSLNNPLAVAVDALGNVFIADSDNERIRRIDALTQTITTYAGTGVAGSGGEDLAATSSPLDSPSGVAVDGAGNLFIVDQNNHRIRRVSKASGKIKTIAGKGTSGFGGDGGPALDALLSLPSSIAADETGNHIFIGDVSNQRVRKLIGTTTPPQNSLPVVATIASQSLKKGQTLDVIITATDADNDAVTFALLNAPAFASIINANPAQRTATLHLAPTSAADVGTFNNVIVEATDSKSGKGQSNAFSITISNATNTPPTAVIAGGATVSVTAPAGASSATVTLNGSGSSDPDGDPLTYQWTEGAVTLGTSSTITPSLNLGTHTITLTVNDGKGGTGTATQTVTVNAASTNAPPTAVIAGGAAVMVDATGPSGAVVTLNGSPSSDPNGDPLTFVWMEGATVLGTASTITPTLSVGTHQITLTVNDGKGGTGTATQTVTVKEFVSSTLSLNSVDPSAGRQGQTLEVTLTGTGFRPGLIVNFSGDGITETVMSVTSTKIVVKLVIAPNAPTGSGLTTRRNITLINPDGVASTLSRVFAIFPR